MKNIELKTAIADRLARISTQSTLNLFISEEGNETMFNLKNSLQADLRYYDTMPTTAQDISDKEHKHTANLDRIALNDSIIKDLAKCIKATTDPDQINRLCQYMQELIFENKTAKAENLIINGELSDLYKKLDYTYSPAFDLYQVAFTAILEKLNENKTLDILTAQMDIDKAVDFSLTYYRNKVVATVPYKTKDGEKEYTLKQWADKAVRTAINEKRNNRATKTLYIIADIDEDGNEILLQADALTTAGGIADIYEKNAFADTLAKLDLTDSELLIVRLLMQGKTTRQIADRLGVKAHTTIVRRIEKIRKKATTAGLAPTTTAKK